MKIKLLLKILGKIVLLMINHPSDHLMKNIYADGHKSQYAGRMQTSLCSEKFSSVRDNAFSGRCFSPGYRFSSRMVSNSTAGSRRVSCGFGLPKKTIKQLLQKLDYRKQYGHRNETDDCELRIAE